MVSDPEPGSLLSENLVVQRRQRIPLRHVQTTRAGFSYPMGFNVAGQLERFVLASRDASCLSPACRSFECLPSSDGRTATLEASGRTRLEADPNSYHLE